MKKEKAKKKEKSVEWEILVRVYADKEIGGKELVFGIMDKGIEVVWVRKDGRRVFGDVDVK